MFTTALTRLFFLPLMLLMTVILGQRDCEKDGDTSMYSQSGLVVSFDNLCGRDINAAADFPDATPEARRSDCLDRCVKKAPLCYGFDYTPYVSPTTANCWLMNNTFSASSATYRSFIADAAMLSPSFLAELPENCKTLGLRGCFERDGQLGSIVSSSATPTASSSSTSSQVTSTTITSTASPTGNAMTPRGSGGLSTGAKAGIGAGVGLVALIAILSGILVLLKRVKRKRATAESAVPPVDAYQTNHGDTDLYPKGIPPTYAHMGTSSPRLATPIPDRSTPNIEQIHEIDGRPRHEK